jgi:predicted aldo/keto reductase-like oxidoreductase
MLLLHTWDTCQIPINVSDHHYRSFRHGLLPQLIDRGIGPIGMKSLGGGNKESGGKLVAAGVATAEEAIRYALSQPIASLVVGIDSMKILEQNVKIGRGFTPMTTAEEIALLARVRPHVTDGRHEQHKSTQVFDGPFHRAQHGFV